ncbi:hypothetical protein [Sphingomonas sp. LT1P40]|uniref:hypothetical protein n=1 Tax=Alteristakelama amylovorans TaxID=3096166 RepID=UPI002FCB15F0
MAIARLLAALALVASPAAGAEEPRPVTGAEMRAEARAMAAGNPALLDEIAAADADAARGVLGNGPTSIRQTVPGGGNWAIALTRRPGEPLMVALRRIGPAPVTLAVVDGEGRQVCADTSRAALLSCRIAPGSGKLIARISNPGAAKTDVLLMTN